MELIRKYSILNLNIYFHYKYYPLILFLPFVLKSMLYFLYKYLPHLFSLTIAISVSFSRSSFIIIEKCNSFGWHLLHSPTTSWTILTKWMKPRERWWWELNDADDVAEVEARGWMASSLKMRLICFSRICTKRAMMLAPPLRLPGLGGLGVLKVQTGPCWEAFLFMNSLAWLGRVISDCESSSLARLITVKLPAPATATPLPSSL